MSFQLVPKSVTLNDLERRNGGCHALFHRIRYSFQNALRKMVENTPTLSAAEYFCDIREGYRERVRYA